MVELWTSSKIYVTYGATLMSPPRGSTGPLHNSNILCDI